MAGLSGPLRWAVVIVDLDPVQGHEQAGERRALVVSYEPFHRSGLATVCPISAARTEPRFPGDVPIPAGEAGQTRDAVIVVSQVRTVSLRRVRGAPVGTVTDRRIRASVRRALAHHLGLDIPAIGDGARKADLIREGIGVVTGTHRIAEPRLPLFESGKPDLAERADELLAGFGEQ